MDAKPRIGVSTDRDGRVTAARVLPPRPAAAASGGGYEAGRYARRLKNWVPSQEHINGLLAGDGDMLRARARQQVRDNGYAASAAESFAANLVGAGIVPSSLVADAERKQAIDDAWAEWTDEADADGLTDLYGLQAMAARAMFTSGECFFRLRPRRAEDGLSVPLQLQMIDAAQLPLWKTHLADTTGNKIRCGVEFDRIGRRVAYHFLRQHPADSTEPATSGEFTRVPAGEVLHLYRPLEAGQIRGQPHVTPALLRLFLLDQYDDAELERKKTAALFSGFITQPAPTARSPLGAADQGDGTALLGLSPAALQTLLPGEEIKFSEPADVGGSYEPFQYRNLLGASAGMGVPYTNVTGDLRAANYSSLRAGRVEFRRRLEQLLWAVLVFQFCRPVWARWMEAAALAGAVRLPGFARDRRAWLRVKWIAPKWEWVDPLKDRQAEKLAVDNGWKSRGDVIEAEGEDPIETDRRIAADQKREKDLGLDFIRGSSAAPAPAPAAASDEPAAGDSRPATDQQAA